MAERTQRLSRRSYLFTVGPGGAATAAALKARGYGRVMLVSPVEHGSPDSPMPGRSAA